VIRLITLDQDVFAQTLGMRNEAQELVVNPANA
jgi:hypothetical protein